MSKWNRYQKPERAKLPAPATKLHKWGRDLDDYLMNILWWLCYMAGLVYLWDQLCNFLTYMGCKYFKLREIEGVPYFFWSLLLWCSWIWLFDPLGPFVDVHQHTWILPHFFIMEKYILMKQKIHGRILPIRQK